VENGTSLGQGYGAMKNHTLMSDIMEDMEPDLLSFIKKHVNSFTRWDLLKFFYQNPGAWDTAKSLANCIGRRAERVEAEVVQMAQEGLLRRDERGAEAVYTLTQDAETLTLVEQLVSGSRERTFRMKLVYHILRAGGN
jgi:hypothetical protein